jgi:hypothetical protein
MKTRCRSSSGSHPLPRTNAEAGRLLARSRLQHFSRRAPSSPRGGISATAKDLWTDRVHESEKTYAWICRCTCSRRITFIPLPVGNAAHIQNTQHRSNSLDYDSWLHRPDRCMCQSAAPARIGPRVTPGDLHYDLCPAPQPAAAANGPY